MARVPVPSMSGEQFGKLRERLGMSRKDLAEVLNEALDRKYRPERVGEWERDKPPALVAEFVEQLVLNSTTIPGLSDMIPESAPANAPGDDTPPPSPTGDEPPPPSGQLPIGTGSGIYTRICTDLWATVALATSSMGALTGNTALTRDGGIIDADKDALGKAWGKLAETNETFRNMLMSTVTGGAWLEIAVVTGVTANKLVANHRELARLDRIRAQAEGEDDHGHLHAA